MTQEEQLALLEKIKQESSFVAASVDYDETPEERMIRERFEQRVLRMSSKVLRYVGGSMGLIPELIVGVWDNFSKEELAQVLIHAYRKGLRISEAMDAVYPASTKDEESVEKVPERAKKVTSTPVTEKKDKKGNETMAIDVWDELDGTAGTPEDAESSKEEPAKKKETRKRSTAKKVTTKGSEAVRPEKSALEAKVDDLTKAVMQMQNTLTEQNKLLDAIVNIVEGTEPVIIRNSINIDQLLEAAARAMVQVRWLNDQTCITNELNPAAEYKAQKGRIDKLIEGFKLRANQLMDNRNSDDDD